MRKIILVCAEAGLAATLAAALAACGPMTVKVETRLVMPDDNMLVDCDIEPPPPLADYLAVFQPEDNTEVGKLKAALKAARERERKLSDMSMKNIGNLDVCNRRWKGQREFKAKAKAELEAAESKKGK